MVEFIFVLFLDLAVLMFYLAVFISTAIMSVGFLGLLRETLRFVFTQEISLKSMVYFAGRFLLQGFMLAFFILATIRLSYEAYLLWRYIVNKLLYKLEIKRGYLIVVNNILRKEILKVKINKADIQVKEVKLTLSCFKKICSHLYLINIVNLESSKLRKRHKIKFILGDVYSQDQDTLFKINRTQAVN